MTSQQSSAQSDRESQAKAVRAANLAFYRAFESLDLKRMEKAWHPGDDIQCVHPGAQPLLGWGPVMDSWQAIFRGTGYVEFEIEGEGLFHSESLAVVTNYERLVSAGPTGTVRGLVRATNVFRKRDGDWLLTIHHASPVA